MKVARQAVQGGGFTEFYDASTAANGTFIANAGTVSGAGGGLILFFDDSTGGGLPD